MWVQYSPIEIRLRFAIFSVETLGFYALMQLFRQLHQNLLSLLKTVIWRLGPFEPDRGAKRSPYPVAVAVAGGRCGYIGIEGIKRRDREKSKKEKREGKKGRRSCAPVEVFKSRCL